VLAFYQSLLKTTAKTLYKEIA